MGFSFEQIITMLFEELVINVLLPGVLGSMVTGGIFLLFRQAIRNWFEVPLLLPETGKILMMGLYIILLNLAVSMVAYLYVMLRLKNTEIALLVKEEN